MSGICVQLVKETGAFLVTTALSCGPSQLFGLIKLVVDISLLLINYNRKNALISNMQKCRGNWCAFKTSPIACLIAKKLGISANNLTQNSVERYFTSKKKKAEEKIKTLGRSIGADVCALIPVIGAHISWRVATQYKGKRFTPIFSRGVQQLLEHSKNIASRPLFWGRRSKEYHSSDIRGESIDVSISTKKRKIAIRHALADELSEKGEFLRGKYAPGKDKVKRATVILFHPNQDGIDMSAADLMDESAQLYRRKGYNTLAFTFGGYEGGPGVTTSEKSMYQDIEAVKSYLANLGVEEVGYHGFSLGTGAAMQAATGESRINFKKTLFVVLDQPYTSAAAIGENVAGCLGKGVMSAGCPVGLDVELPGDLWIKTDGLNNLKKAAQLKKKNVPLICFEAEEDFFMGRNKQNGKYVNNFAQDLLKARYGDSLDNTQHLVTLSGRHGFNSLRFTRLWKTDPIPSTGMSRRTERI